MHTKESVHPSLLEHPLLGDAETADLIRAAQAGDAHAMSRLVRHNLRLVFRMALPMSTRYRVPVADLMAYGVMGLQHAIMKFDLSRGLALSTYSGWWIRATVRREMERGRRTIRLSCSANKRLNEVRRAKAAILARTGNDEPTADAIRSQLGWADDDHHLRKVELLMQYLTPELLSLDREVYIDQNRKIPFVELVEDRRAIRADHGMEGRETLATLRAAVAGLEPRLQGIITRRFGLDGGEERSLNEIGAEPEYRVSRERIRQLEAKALAKLRRVMERYETT